MTLRTLLDRFDLLLDTPESVPKLRRFILRLALQGRLTEQKPGDTDVDVLAKRLQAEKQRLYDEGEIRKPRSLDPLDEGEEWHRVPSEWTWTKVGEVGRIIGGSTPRTSNDEYWTEDGIAWLTPGDLGDHDGKMVSRGDRDISKEGLDSCSATLLPPGSVLFSSRAPIGYVAIAADELSTNQGFKSVRPYEMAMSHYIYWFLKYAGKRINDEASGTTFTEVSGTDLANIPFPLPPLEEQQRIVETVDGLMDECDVLEQQQERERTLQVQVGTAATEALQSADDAEALRPAWERIREHFATVTATPEGVDALRQTILQLAVQGRLTERDPDDTPADMLLEQIQQEKQRLYDAGEIRKPKDLPEIGDERKRFDLPGQWILARLGKLIHFKNGYAFRSKNYSDKGVGIVKIGDIQNGEVTEQDMDRLPPGLAEEKIEKYNVEPGALLIGMSGSVGKLGFNTSDKTYLLNQRVGKITPISAPMGSVSRRYIYHFLRTRVDENLRIAEGSAIKNLSTTQIKETPIPLPPPEEQRRLVETVDRLMSFCNDLGDLLSDSNERGEQLLEVALRDVSVDEPDTAPTGVTA